MTIATEISSSGPYIGNGVTTIFEYDFKIVDERHLRVVVTNSAGSASDLSLDQGDFIVSGVGSEEGGSIAVAVAPVVGESLTVLRLPPFTQETDLQNQGSYYAQTVEDRFDLTVMQIQSIREESGRSLKVEPGQVVPSIDQIVNAQAAATAAIGAANGNFVFPTVAVAQAANIPAVIHQVLLNGYSAPNDGLGGLYSDTNNGNSDKFVSANGRTWYRTPDVSYDRFSLNLQRRVTSESAFFSKLASSNVWDRPYLRFNPTATMGVNQTSGFDIARGYVYTHHNVSDGGSGELGVISRYPFSNENVTADSSMLPSALISHSGLAVEKATGKLWTGGQNGKALRFTYNPGGAPLAPQTVRFNAAGGKVSISYDQKWFVMQLRSAGVIANRFYPLDAVLSSIGSAADTDVSALEDVSKFISFTDVSPDNLYFQGHACDGKRLYTMGAYTNVKTVGQLLVHDMESKRLVFSTSSFDVGMATVNPVVHGVHWEPEGLDFITVTDEDPIPTLAVSIAGDAAEARRNCVFLIGPAQPLPGYNADKPNSYNASAVTGEYWALLPDPDGSGNIPPRQHQSTSRENATVYEGCWSTSSGTEAGRVIERVASGKPADRSVNAVDGLDIYIDRFRAAYGGASLYGGYYFVTVSGTPSAGYIPVKQSWGAMGPGESQPTDKLIVEGRGVGVRGFLNLGPLVPVVIVSDAITAVASHMSVDTEGGAATDNLSTINGGSAGDLLILRTTSSARDVTLVDGSSLRLSSACTLATLTDTITLICSSPGVWVEIGRSINS